MSRYRPPKPLITIIGATGTGKSQLAISLAERFSGEIINGDAMQMYDGLPIATNKIPSLERRNIPHHLLGSIGLKEKPWGVGTFRQHAIRIVEDIISRGKVPILVGGTHYYTQALLFKDFIVENYASHNNGVSGLDKPTWPILEASTEEILQELRQVDPVMASRWHPNDRRKIQRSLEIYLRCGKRASDIYEQQRLRNAGKKVGCTNDESENYTTALPHGGTISKPSPLLFSPLIFWAHVDLPELKARLSRRVDCMVERGLMSEAQSMYDIFQELKSQGYAIDESYGIWAAIGYKEFIPYFKASQDKATTTEALKSIEKDCIERVKIETRQYTRLQIKWIRNKLLKDLMENSLDDKLFLLDATDLTQWQRNVEAPSIDLVSAFLKGDILPQPKSISATAERLLVSGGDSNLYARLCSICNKTLTSDEDWERHVKGGKHKRAMKPKIDWRALYPKENKNVSRQQTNSIDDIPNATFSHELTLS